MTRSLRRRIEREWRRAGPRLGVCAICAEHLHAGERARAGEIYFAEGIVLYRGHSACIERLKGEPNLQRCVADEAYRSLYGAGPDDVAGVA